MIEICNLRNEKIKNIYDIRIDRYNKILGNPFRMYNENEREKVCNQYQEYFNNKLKNGDKDFLKELDKIYKIYEIYGKVRLFCWCYPKKCHAETIKEYLENRRKK